MLIKISKSGEETDFICKTDVVVPYSATGVQLMSIKLPVDCSEFSPKFEAGITDQDTALSYDIPACASLGALVDFFNTFEIGGVRVFASYRTFADNWEVWNETAKSINLSDEFASYFRFVSVCIGCRAFAMKYQ